MRCFTPPGSHNRPAKQNEQSPVGNLVEPSDAASINAERSTPGNRAPSGDPPGVREGDRDDGLVGVASDPHVEAAIGTARRCRARTGWRWRHTKPAEVRTRPPSSTAAGWQHRVRRPRRDPARAQQDGRQVAVGVEGLLCRPGHLTRKSPSSTGTQEIEDARVPARAERHHSRRSGCPRG